MGITNTILRAELAAIATAVIHGYTHIATDSLTSLHQIKKKLSHPNLYRHHIQGDVLQSIAKAIRQSPSPIQFFKVKSHAGIIGNEHADALAKKSATTTPTLLTSPSEQQALREIPSTTSTGLQKMT
jgi:ribonuclease HI